ncbi:MAG: single-stranded-DNA-specific exonuclease RecJ [Fibrobacter sp.]|jgi:single-stranded-DNA-specific exonuclease|nr:single-stranded-DNA-specific exonuclease RecJ [Fibrobacter sp.]
MQELAASTIANELKIPHLIARLLVRRGYTSVSEAYSILNTSSFPEHDPYLMNGMKEAVDYVRRILENPKARVLIFGDYDLDGMTSTALLVLALKKLGIEAAWKLPCRFDSGYGLSQKAVDEIHESGVTHLITVDTGITAVTEIEYANSKGIQVMVLDHHQPSGDGLPACEVLLDPHQESCDYPNPFLCGVGIAYKLVSALFQELSIPGAEDYLDLVALGTLADLVPLSPENRLLVRGGLAKIKQSKLPGIRELCEVQLGDRKQIGGQEVLFRLAPLMNAPGRMEKPDIAMELLICEDAAKAKQLVQELNRFNTLRKKKETEITKATMDWVETRYPNGVPDVLVVDGENWHLGVIGIVAAKVAQHFGRPTAILSIQPDGSAHASARAMYGFNWHRALFECRHLFSRWGGHANAAGFNLKKENIETLRNSLLDFAKKEPPDFASASATDYDIPIALSELNEEVMDHLQKMEPYGGSFPYPVFRAEKVKLLRVREVRGGHLQMELAQDRQHSFSAIAFGMGKMESELKKGKEINVNFEVSWNSFNGMRNIQLMIKSID